MKKVTIYTDGGCHGNPGPGAWAAVLTYGKHVREMSGGEPATTNNRMELSAAIEALRALKEPCQIELHTDSEYVKNGITTWIKGWKRKGWKTSTKKPVKNVDLWKALDEQTAQHQITWKWVKGHAGIDGNERCDTLANEYIAKLKQTHKPSELKQFLNDFIRQQKALEDPSSNNPLEL